MSVWKISFVLAIMDLTIATICAIYGDEHFVVFMLLAGLMYIHGVYFKAKDDGKTGE